MSKEEMEDEKHIRFHSETERIKTIQREREKVPFVT